MGEYEAHLYNRTDVPYDYAETFGRKIIREGTKIMQDLFKYRGNYYWVIGGRVLTKGEAAKLEDERRLEGRLKRREELR